MGWRRVNRNVAHMNHEVFFFLVGGGYASSSRLATPHVNVSMYISKHELRCLCQRMQNLSICVKDLLA